MGDQVSLRQDMSKQNTEITYIHAPERFMKQVYMKKYRVHLHTFS